MDQYRCDRSDCATEKPAARQTLKSGIFACVWRTQQHERGYAGEEREGEVASQTDDNYRPWRDRPGR